MSVVGESNNKYGRAAIKHALLLTRPYSWIDAALNTVVGVVWVSEGGSSPNVGLAAIVGLCLWFSLNWVSERVQRDPGRTPVSWPLALAPVSVAGVLALTTGGTATIVPLLAFLALTFLYPWKARRPEIGPFGPAIRGAQTASIIAVGLAMSNGARPALTLLLGFALVQASRSLAGDLRDVETDKHELPRLLGVPRAKQIVLGLLIGGIALLQVAGLGPIALAFLAAQFLGQWLGPQERHYELHLLFVITSVGAKLAVVSNCVGLDIPWMVALAILQVGLACSYAMVPRPANAAFLHRLRRMFGTERSSVQA